MFLDVAMAPNNNEVQIHQFAAGKWKHQETLMEHGQRVTGIDWAPTSNRIVTCGAVCYLVASSILSFTLRVKLTSLVGQQEWCRVLLEMNFFRPGFICVHSSRGCKFQLFHCV